jgi:hypothetical protein
MSAGVDGIEVAEALGVRAWNRDRRRTPASPERRGSRFQPGPLATVVQPAAGMACGFASITAPSSRGVAVRLRNER